MAYLRIYSKDKWDKVNPENKEFYRDYEQELKAQRKSTSSIKEYTKDLRMFLCYNYDNGNKPLYKVKRKEYRNFFLYLQENGVSSARINRLQSSLRTFLEYLSIDEDYSEDFKEQNRMRTVKSQPKQPVRDIVFLTDDEISDIIDKLLEQGKTQIALYVSLSYDSAGRINEVKQVEKEGFTTNKKTNVVIGKRGKQFPLIYFNRTRIIAKQYLTERGEDDILSLFTKDTKLEPATQDTFRYWITIIRKIYKELYGEEKMINPHAFRHSALENFDNGTHNALTELGQDKLDINTLKVIAHHESIDTTNGYLKNKDEAIINNLLGI